MFELIQVLDSESRQVFFGTVMDVFRSGRREVSARDILASVVRAPSLADDIRSSRVDMERLLAFLASPPLGDGTFEKLQKAMDGESSEDVDGIGLPKDGGFVHLPLTAEAQILFNDLRSAFAGAADESVTPRELLVAILRSDQQLRDDCARFGLRV